MSPDALNRAARQIALPQIGLEGQQRIAAATVVVAGDDLACEVMARALAAAGVGHLRLMRRTGALPDPIAAALVGSNPDLTVETSAWPGGAVDAAGAAWLSALNGADIALRSGFDDDPMLRAAVRLGLPMIVARGRQDDDGIDVVSFRRHGPCPHAPLDVPARTGGASMDGPGAVIAAQLAAAEALVVLAGATVGAARARHVSVTFDADADNPTPTPTPTRVPARATDIPWTPECFACGGSGSEMSFV